MRRRVGLIGAVLVLVVLFFAINMLAGAGLRSARLDVTQGHAFTLTAGSKNIARSLDEPVRLTMYYSAKLAQGIPPLQMYAQRVRELLEEFARVSGGKIKLEVIDPEPFSDAEDKAVGDGLTGQRLNAAGENLYFGLVGTNSVDTKEVIAFFDPAKERFLEYDVTRLVYSLAHPKKKVVGLITSLQMNGGFTMDPRTRQPTRTPAWGVMDQVKGLFEVKPLPAQLKEVPADIDVLLVVHPKKLSDEALYAIDQYVMRGGRMVAFVDPLCENDEAGAQNPAEQASVFDKLLNAWGVEVEPGKVAADKELALQVMMGSQQRSEQVGFVVWLKAKKEQMSKEDPVTGDLSVLNIATAGIIRARPLDAAAPGGTAPAARQNATIVPLITTTKTAMELPVQAVGPQPDPKMLLKMYAPGDHELVLAARVTGNVDSAFPAGAPAPDPTATPPIVPPPAPLARSVEPINVVLVSDADMLSDSLWMQRNIFGQMQRVADNADFLLSCLDNLSGSNDLISVRARKEEARPFELVDKMRSRAQDRFRAEQDALEKKLDETQRKLGELQAKKGNDAGALVMSAEQRAEVEKFRTEINATNKQLRAVKLSLNKDIERLGTQLKFINIGLIPVLVSIGALGLGALRASRRRRVARAA